MPGNDAASQKQKVTLPRFPLSGELLIAPIALYLHLLYPLWVGDRLALHTCN